MHSTGKILTITQTIAARKFSDYIVPFEYDDAKNMKESSSTGNRIKLEQQTSPSPTKSKSRSKNNFILSTSIRYQR